MARAVVRLIIGLLMALAVGLMFGPIFWPASAESPNLVASQPVQVPTVTTRVTAPPSSSSASTTPTTRRPTVSTRPRVTGSTTSTSTTSTSTTSTTVAPIPAPAPAPVTLPLASAAQSGSIGAFFPILSAIGIVTLVGLLTAQWFLTKPGRKGPTL
ncbi:MAG: hypothetical protein QOF30_1809 [Acidimicrobiaceae bacterium]|nr:hypothetical protein [Acidimicrobiaceae bacterium]